MNMDELPARICGLLDAHGPQLGKELLARLDGVAPMLAWKACMSDDRIHSLNCARYYLRFDVTRDNQVRLSPSLLRNFLTFTLLHLTESAVPAASRAIVLANEHRNVSFLKLDLARRFLLGLPDHLHDKLARHACCFIGGDVAYFLAHQEPRRAHDGRYQVNGSDIDLVFVHNAELTPDDCREIEAAMLELKSKFLQDPNFREEFDFILKPINTMVSQLAYGDIHQKIASKILYESIYVMGRLDIFDALRTQLDMFGTSAKIRSDFAQALDARAQTISRILDTSHAQLAEPDAETRSLFFPTQERLEFQ